MKETRLKLMQQFNISEAQIEADVHKLHWFSYGTKVHNKVLLLQIITKVTNGAKVSQSKTKRRKYGCKVTPNEVIEIGMKYQAHKKPLQEAVNNVINAFNDNNL